MLDTTERSWNMFLSIVRKAEKANATWESPIRKKVYRIKKTEDRKIIIQREDGEGSQLGIDGYLFFLKHFDDEGGRIRRTDYSASVAKRSAIVHFHPFLNWTEDYEWIEVVGQPNSDIADVVSIIEAMNDEEQRQLIVRKIRRGQKQFRNNLMKLYNGQCCISGCFIIELLDACHIQPHSISGINKTDNRLLLRTDLHTLFDEGLLQIEPSSKTVRLAPALRNSEYNILHGMKLRTRIDGKHPAQQFLQNRWNANRF